MTVNQTGIETNEKSVFVSLFCFVFREEIGIVAGSGPGLILKTTEFLPLRRRFLWIFGSTIDSESIDPDYNPALSPT